MKIFKIRSHSFELTVVGLCLASCTHSIVQTDASVNSQIQSTSPPLETQLSNEVQRSEVTSENEQVLTVSFSTEQRASLNSLDIPIAIPDYIPDGFQVYKVIANACHANAPQTGSCREGSSYTIAYRNPQETCLLVRAIGGGVGGGSSEFSFPTQTNLLGQVVISFGPPTGMSQIPSSEQLERAQDNLHSFPKQLDSADISPHYSVSVGDSEYGQREYGCGSNTSITPLALERVVQSLILLEE